ncbi:MAG: MarR family transcriptional regulator [Clostridia bacterium]|nr:MarR family transcriptional regulator [Clostridia bacterium]
MSRDPRCEWLIEKSVRYHALSGKVIEKRLAQMCQKHGLADTLCLGDYEFLAAVANAKTENVNMAQIARLLGVNPSSATRRNRRLLDCGLVSKTSDAADERRYQIALTDEGRAFYAEMDQVIFDVTQVMYSTVTAEEMNAVYAFTEKCIENLQKILDE